MERNNTNSTGGRTPEEVIFLVLGIGIVSTLGNGLLLIVMTKNSRQVFASLGSYFIYNLAIADFLTGLNSIGWGVNALHPFILPLQKALLTIFWITTQVSFFTIFVMSTERLVAIAFPFKAALLMSKKKTTIYCILVWLFSVSSAVLINWKAEHVQFFLTILFEVVILFIVIEYVQVFRHLRLLWQNSKTRIYNRQNNNDSSSSKKSKDLEQEYEVTIVVVTLAVVLVVTVFPHMIVQQIILCNHLFATPLPLSHPAQKFTLYYFPVELLNFAVNPIVYGWRLPKYRRAFVMTFGCSRKRYRNHSINGSPRTTRTTYNSDKEMALTNC